jgi:hypothetical protein
VLSRISLYAKQFQFLFLDKNILKNEGAGFMADILRRNNSLIQVSLASNGIQSQGAALLFQALA